MLSKKLIQGLLIVVMVGGVDVYKAAAQTTEPIYYADGKYHEYSTAVNIDKTAIDGNNYTYAVRGSYYSTLHFKSDLDVNVDSSKLQSGFGRNTNNMVMNLGGNMQIDGNLSINADSRDIQGVNVYGLVAVGNTVVNGDFKANIYGGQNNIIAAGLGSAVLNGNSDVYLYVPKGNKYAYGYTDYYDRRAIPEAVQLNGGQHKITIEAENGAFLAGIYRWLNPEVKLGSGSSTEIVINNTGDGSVKWSDGAVKGIEGQLKMAANSNLYIQFDLPRENTYRAGEFDQNIYRPINGIVGLDLSDGSIVAEGANINMQLSGAPIWDGVDMYGNKFGLGSVAGIATRERATINGNVNINILSEQGVGIRIEDGRPSVGVLNLNGTTIIHTNNGYALMSETVSIGDDRRYSGAGVAANAYAEININTAGGNLVQMTGDLDHRTIRKSHFTINLDQQDSFLYGASLKSNVTANLAEGITDIRLANNAAWYMTANSIVNDLTFDNHGLLDMTPSGQNGYETLTATRVLGDNGKLLFNTDLQKTFDEKNVAVASDRLVILNQSAGRHAIDVLDTSLLTQVKSEGYVLLVEDRSQGAAQFVSGELHKGGIFKYKPLITNIDPTDYDGVPTASTNWYLTGFEREDSYEEESYINTGLVASRYISYLNEQDTLIKRLGELRQHDKEQGVWVRVRGGKNTVDNYGLQKNSYVTTYIGYDDRLKNDNNTKRYAGLALNHTKNNFYYADGASGKGQSNVLTLYNTRLGDKGHYLDLVGKIGRMSNDYNYDGYHGDISNWFYSLSAEYGRSIVRDKGWYYEPQVQFTLGHVNGSSYSTSDTNVDAEAITSAILRAGILFGRKYNNDNYEKMGSYYAKLFWNHEFGGRVVTNMYDKYGDRTRFSKTYNGSWLTAGLGTSTNLDKKTNLYIDIEKAFGGKVNSGWSWQAGIRWRW